VFIGTACAATDLLGLLEMSVPMALRMLVEFAIGVAFVIHFITRRNSK
jgi:hypothetical protein